MPAVRLLTLPFLLLGLISCSGKSLTQVRGEVRNWTYGAGSVEFLSDDLKTLSSADLDRVGRFTILLPDAQTMTPLLQDSLVPAELPAGCTNTVRASSAAKFYSLGDVTAYPVSGQKNAYTLISEDRGGSPVRVTRRLFIFASQAVNVTGQLSCPVGSIQAVASYGLSLKAGWNRVASNQTTQASGGSQTSIGTVGEDGFERWSLAPER